MITSPAQEKLQVKIFQKPKQTTLTIWIHLY